MILKDKQLFLFDLDGTIHLGSSLIDGAKELLEEIKKQGKKYMFFTNNSSRTKDEYITSLGNMGLEVTYDDIITAGYSTAIYLANKKQNANIFVVGTNSFKKLLSEHGLNVIETPDNNIDFVVVGLDFELNYEKIRTACELVSNGAEFIGANPDLMFPIPGGKSLPDTAAICKLIEIPTGKQPIYLGKPSNEILEYCTTLTGVSKADTVVVGDRLYTDIACGFNNGCDTILVLSGESKAEDIEHSPFKPTLVLDSVKSIDIQ